MRWLDDITDLMDVSLSELWEVLMDREVWHAPWGPKESDWVTEQQWNPQNLQQEQQTPVETTDLRWSW